MRSKQYIVSLLSGNVVDIKHFKILGKVCKWDSSVEIFREWCSYQAYQSMRKWDSRSSGNGVGEGKKGSPLAVRELVEQDPVQEDLILLI